MVRISKVNLPLQVKLNQNTADDRTNGTVEAWNLILKRIDHPKHRLRPDVFIKEHYEVLRGRQISFRDHLPIKKRKRVEVCI